MFAYFFHFKSQNGNLVFKFGLTYSKTLKVYLNLYMSFTVGGGEMSRD